MKNINLVLHAIIFYFINCNVFVKGFFMKNYFLSPMVIIDFKKTFRNAFPINHEFKFIQIGGNDGVSFDSLFYRIKERVSKGIIIEPSPKYFKLLQKNYSYNKNIILLENAIFSKNEVVKLYELNENGLKKLPEFAKGIGSLNRKHLERAEIDSDDIEYFEVQGITFSKVIDDFPIFSNIDFLQIDTEGYDFEILKSIDFSSFKCKMIKFEHLNLSEEDKRLSFELLSKYGYFLFFDDMDGIALLDQKFLSLKYKRS